MLKISLNQWIIISQISWMSLFVGTGTHAELWHTGFSQDCSTSSGVHWRACGLLNCAWNTGRRTTLSVQVNCLSHQCLGGSECDWVISQKLLEVRWIKCHFIGQCFLPLACCDASWWRSTGSGESTLTNFSFFFFWLVMCLQPECHKLWQLP